MKLMFMIKSTVLALLVLFLTSCGSQADEAGECKLDCSKSVIATSDFEMDLMYEGGTVQCGATRSVNGISEAKFRVFRNREGDTTIAGPEMKAKVSIRPSVGGFVDNEADDIPDPKKYRGILTPEADFCSDSCGVVTIQYRSYCPGLKDDSVAQVHVTSGAVASPIHEVTLKAPTE